MTWPPELPAGRALAGTPAGVITEAPAIRGPEGRGVALAGERQTRQAGADAAGAIVVEFPPVQGGVWLLRRWLVYVVPILNGAPDRTAGPRGASCSLWAGAAGSGILLDQTARGDFAVADGGAPLPVRQGDYLTFIWTGAHPWQGANDQDIGVATIEYDIAK